MSNYKTVFKKFVKKPNLCNLLILISYETWERIEFARTRNGLKIYETTITQNILFSLRKFSELYNINSLKMFEAVDEKNNGNDIELILKTNKGYLIIPTQSKIIYKNEKYPRMEHGNQINDLISYAKNLKGIPVYLLYNYTKISAKKIYGCSIIGANYLKENYTFKKIDGNGNLKWTIPSYSDLHPNPSLPLSYLGCCSDINKSNDLFKNFLGIEEKKLKDIKIKFYTENEIFKNEYWKDFDNTRTIAENNIKKIETPYSPKYRIVINSENIIL